MATITFKYTVRDKTGKVTSGRLEGESRDAVAAKLRQMGYIVLDLSEDRLAALNKIQFGTSVKTKDITIFARQFATMINAGLSLTKCLSILADQSESKELREVIAQVGRDVEAGQSLSEAMAKHPKIFPPIFINMVRAGETGGVLDEVLLRVADHFENDAKLKGRIKSAMTYPVAMAVLVLLVLIAMMIFVVPTFQKMFADMGGKLPVPTQILVNISAGARGLPGLITLVAVIVGTIAFRAWKSTDSGRLIWDGIKLRMPIVGPLVRKMSLARFTRTFGTLVAAGVPILSALDIVADTSGNEVVAQAVKKVRSAIKEGETIAKPLGENPIFPSMLVQMIAVGEETGALDAMLTKIADFYDEEVSAAVDGLTSVIEPLMMATLAVVVGGIVIALYMPMFQVITLVK
ncbi:type II secretion system F family protein [Coriobacteriia bacterium Es71-Z0120]|uniref:type II secretion system F family protein n=1 Tax=Parvivirga hydrogeniphila TaxID=2939460 RepID=UPI0022610141|nr:type II secretion system F family protein [Parvivirga hydrogeniphila]MCL4079155.1 type II secretion system F family protein [Parvivirga hydrogeniphila]